MHVRRNLPVFLPVESLIDPHARLDPFQVFEEEKKFKKSVYIVGSFGSKVEEVGCCASR